MRRGGCTQGFVNAGKKLRSVPAKKMKGAGFYQAFQYFAISDTRIQPAAKILQRSEMTLLLSLANCGFHRAFAHVFDRSQSVADGPVAGVGDPDCLWLGRATGVNDAGYSFRRKFQSALIDIRRQNVDAHAFAFANEDRNLVGVVNLVAEQASHELNRVMRFQVSGLITDEPVSRAVALVKSVACKFLEQIEDGVRLFFRNFVRPRTTFDEVFSFLRHLLFVFFSHGAPEKIALRERIAGQ